MKLIYYKTGDYKGLHAFSIFKSYIRDINEEYSFDVQMNVYRICKSYISYDHEYAGRRYICNICGQRFRSYDGTEKHIAVHHMTEIIDTINNYLQEV